ncbi:MAG: FecR domain-containing protein [Burkholderiales bacterium]|nr:FecR domain-containing protein [Burkholderiales bacterium]
MSRRSISPTIVLAALVALGWVPAGALAAETETAIGQVSLLIGDARVFKRDGSQQLLRQGAEVFVGDRVETSANGHVHLRFIDRGAVSVRPDSVLEVQSYHFDPARPSSNEVRLRVEQGTARSISGAATEADKSRFRLNTPIAAIGVRGTDFIVQTTRSEVRAVVTQGAISMSPFGGGCTAAALGSCGGVDAKILSADMGKMMVEIRAGETFARLAPALTGLLPGAAVAAGSADASSRERALAGESAARAQALAAAYPSLDASVRSNDRAAADLLAIAPTSRFDARELSTLPDAKAQMVWGRWSFASPTAFDNISLSFKDASAGREVTVGDLDAGLFRASSVRTSLSDTTSGPQSGRFDLRLTRAQAGFEIGGRVEAASVDGGTLSLDLGLRTFATALSLSSLSGGKAELRVGGQIQDNGVFTARDNEQRVAGAISLDGKEAGYLFERVAGGGVFRGKTLWGKGL